MPKRILDISKRHFKRLVQEEISCYSATSRVTHEGSGAGCSGIRNTQNSSNEDLAFDEAVTDIPEESPSFDNKAAEILEACQSSERAKKLSDNLASWAISHKISRNALEDILKILREEGLNVPSTRKTLLNTKVSNLDICEMTPGQYFHFGLRKSIELLNLKIPNVVNEVYIDIFVDGIPIFKSSSKSLWPILGSISENRFLNPFLIGTYIGPSKPRNVNLYLEKFVQEYIQIQNEGIIINGRRINLKIRLFTCDSPARAYITGTVGHTSSHGCAKCQQEAKKINNRLTYSKMPGARRTDENFKNRTDKLHHSSSFHNELHPLEHLGIRMITQFPLDVMHLIDLGIMKKKITLYS